jgi:adenosylcobinamide-phosphate synthase
VPAEAARRAAGLALGVLLDQALADPRRWHPVAGFGKAATALESALYRRNRLHGSVFTLIGVGVPVAAGIGLSRLARRSATAQVALTAVVTWAALGGSSLVREGQAMATHLDAGDLRSARARLAHLCARDPADLDAEALARATVESLAENASDAVVAPLLWGAVAGVPGLVGYRAVNTLDAMVGYTSPHYRSFGWASARLDDLANVVPARVTALLIVAAAPAVGGRVPQAWKILRRDARRHPSPNAGRCEAAAAGVLGVRLGGTNSYGGHVEQRPALGDGPAPTVPDLHRAIRLTRVVSAAAAVAAVAVAGWRGTRRAGRA